MAIEGELSGTDGVTCECGRKLELEVQMSAAGYYLGYFCDDCGPWSRESDYFKTRKLAEAELERIKRSESSSSLRTTEFAG